MVLHKRGILWDICTFVLTISCTMSCLFIFLSLNNIECTMSLGCRLGQKSRAVSLYLVTFSHTADLRPTKFPTTLAASINAPGAKCA